VVRFVRLVNRNRINSSSHCPQPLDIHSFIVKTMNEFAFWGQCVLSVCLISCWANNWLTLSRSRKSLDHKRHPLLAKQVYVADENLQLYVCVYMCLFMTMKGRDWRKAQIWLSCIFEERLNDYCPQCVPHLFGYLTCLFACQLTFIDFCFEVSTTCHFLHSIMMMIISLLNFLVLLLLTNFVHNTAFNMNF